MKNTIKFFAVAVRWFDKVNGNTYHSVKITRCRDGAVIVCPFQYGYGTQYEATALQEMMRVKWIPKQYRTSSDLWRYQRECGYPVKFTVTDGLKRDCVANGTL